MEIFVPADRCATLQEEWLRICTPIKQLDVEVIFHYKSRTVELKTAHKSKNFSDFHKVADFIKAVICGFKIEDALDLLRRDDLYIEVFEVQDVKRSLKGDHLSRAIGRLAGKDGKTKFSIENVTETKIVIADLKVHILGSYENIQLARRHICNLILGYPPSKVHNQLRNTAGRKTRRY